MAAAPAAPVRIVALAPSAAEIVFALGAAPRVVGVSDFAADLPEARGKVRLGGFSPDLEKVLALSPDLAVVSRDGTDRAAAERLAALGIRVVATRGTSFAGIEEDIRLVGRAIGEPERAEALATGLAGRVAAARRKARGRKDRGLTAAVVIWPDPPVVAGSSSFVGDLLAAAGLLNAAPASAGEWPRVTQETLLAWSPSLIVRPDTPENRAVFDGAFRAGGAFALLPAVKAGRVVTLPGALLERPGPRLVEALELLVDRTAELFP